MSTDVTGRALIVLEEADWRTMQRSRIDRVEPWIAPRRERRSAGRKHPVDDFPFEYYPYSVAKLAAWHPGAGIVLLDDAGAFLEHPAYSRTDGGVAVSLEALGRVGQRLNIVIRLLSRTDERPAHVGCFGLHEWAMVHRLPTGELRHESHPLGLPMTQIEQVVDELGLRCPHLDAYRFFTPSALPLNTHVPTGPISTTGSNPAACTRTWISTSTRCGSRRSSTAAVSPTASRWRGRRENSTCKRRPTTSPASRTSRSGSRRPMNDGSTSTGNGGWRWLPRHFAHGYCRD